MALDCKNCKNCNLLKAVIKTRQMKCQKKIKIVIYIKEKTKPLKDQYWEKMGTGQYYETQNFRKGTKSKDQLKT